MPSVLLKSKSPGNTDGRHVVFKSLIEKQLAFPERAPDNGAGCGRCPTATAVGAMRENARAACLITPDSVVAGERKDPIALKDAGQIGCGIVEAGVLPGILAAVNPEGFDHRGVVWSQEAYVRYDVRTEKFGQEAALIRRAHKTIEVTPEDFPEDGLVHQVLLANLGQPALQVRYPARRCGYDRPIAPAETPDAAISFEPHVRCYRQAGLIQLCRRDAQILSPEPVVSLGHGLCLAPSVND
jgi:hypothetical protein